MAIRLLLLSTHYRKILNFTFEALDQAKSSLERIQEFVTNLGSLPLKEGENPEISSLVEKSKAKFIQGLSHDLNISPSLSAIFEMIKKANILIDQGNFFRTDTENLLREIASINKVLHVVNFPSNTRVKERMKIGQDVEVEIMERTLPQDIEQKVEERERARQQKNYALADRIRDELLAHGVVLEDTKDGVRWKIIKK